MPLCIKNWVNVCVSVCIHSCVLGFVYLWKLALKCDVKVRVSDCDMGGISQDAYKKWTSAKHAQTHILTSCQKPFLPWTTLFDVMLPELSSSLKMMSLLDGEEGRENMRTHFHLYPKHSRLSLISSYHFPLIFFPSSVLVMLGIHQWISSHLFSWLCLPPILSSLCSFFICVLFPSFVKEPTVYIHQKGGGCSSMQLWAIKYVYPPCILWS